MKTPWLWQTLAWLAAVLAALLMAWATPDEATILRGASAGLHSA